jgi:intraflagellar transport protein 80
MSISLKEQQQCSQTRSPITSVYTSSSTSIFLDFSGTLWLRKDEPSSKIIKLFEDQTDIITAFDVCAGHKSNSQLIVVGYESGAIEFLNISGTSQKKIKDAHKGSVIRVAFSPDAQTILSSSEDCSIKLWSRSGMLRSEIAKTESPAFAVAWSPDSTELVYGNGKNITFKNIKPGVNDITVKATDLGVITVLSWSSTENLVLASGEDCKFLLFDPTGQVVHISPVIQDTPFVAGAWSSLSSVFVLSTYNEIILGDKNGKIVSRIGLKTPLTSLGLANDSNQMLLGLESGEYQTCILILYSSQLYKNYSVVFENDHQIVVSDIHSEYKESLEFAGNPVTYFSMAFNKMLVLARWKCSLFDTSNFITPVLFELPNELIFFAGITPGHLYFALLSGQVQVAIYDFLGKQVSSLRLNCQLLNQKLFTLAYESACFVDSTNPKVLQILDSHTGKVTETYTHTNDISKISFNNLSNVVDRKLLFLDSNKDLYMFIPGKTIVKKVAPVVNSFIWHENLDVFVYHSSQKINTVYAPSAFLYDSKFVSLVTKSESVALKSEFLEFNEFTLNSYNERNVLVAHSIDNFAIKLVRMVQDQKLSEAVLQSGLKLARFLKNPLVWAVLAVFALDKKDTNTVELCLAQLECIEKVQFFSELNSHEDKDIAQTKLLSLLNRFEECEKMFVAKKQYLKAVQMHVKMFDFQKALDIAKTAKTVSKGQDWLVDYVIWKRRAYLEEVTQETETDPVFKGLNPSKPLDEIRQLKKEAKTA